MSDGEVEQALRNQLVERLTRIATSKPKKHYLWGKDLSSPVVAWDGLERLGVPLTSQTTKSALALLSAYATGQRRSSATMPLDLLARVVRADPKQAKKIRAALAGLIDSDIRSTDSVADDARFVAAVRGALEALE